MVQPMSLTLTFCMLLIAQSCAGDSLRAKVSLGGVSAGNQLAPPVGRVRTNSACE